MYYSLSYYKIYKNGKYKGGTRTTTKLNNLKVQLEENPKN